jgi:TPR repeat protein
LPTHIGEKTRRKTLLRAELDRVTRPILGANAMARFGSRLVSSLLLLLSWIAPKAAPAQTEAEPLSDIPISKLNAIVKDYLAHKNPNDAQTQYDVAGLYSGVMPGFPLDFAQSASWLRKAAQQGHAKAQAALGERYAEGHGVPEDHAQAVKWYRAAAEQGNGLGQLGLGTELAFGQGGARDEAEAVVWLRKAADQVTPEQVSGAAQSLLGVAYYFGRGVPQDYGKAVGWLQKAGSKGDSAAQALLGEAFLKGRGVAQNEVVGVTWYRRAADQWDPSAQRALAYVYSGGVGVLPDSVEAYKWISLAVMCPASQAQKEELEADRQRFGKEMTPAQIAEARRRATEWANDAKHRRK